MFPRYSGDLRPQALLMESSSRRYVGSLPIALKQVVAFLREFARCLILAVAIESFVYQIIRRRPNIATVAKPPFMPQLQTWVNPLKEIKIFILPDGGAMSSWHVLNAMVFSPVCPGSPVCI